MNSLKNITYSLLVIISFSLISASAQASGISVRIGGYGYGYNLAYNSYYPSAYYGYQQHSYFRGHGPRIYGPPRHYRSYGHSSYQGIYGNRHSERGRNKVAYIKRH